MKMTNEERREKIMELNTLLVDAKCIMDELGWYYMMQIENTDEDKIEGTYHVRTDSKLHSMARACNTIADSFEEKTTYEKKF